MSETTSKGPGREEGREEMQHWGFRSRMVNAHRDFLIEAASERMTDPIARRATINWLRESRRTMGDAEQLAKRWGVTLPDINATSTTSAGTDTKEGRQ